MGKQYRLHFLTHFNVPTLYILEHKPSFFKKGPNGRIIFTDNVTSFVRELYEKTDDVTKTTLVEIMNKKSKKGTSKIKINSFKKSVETCSICHQFLLTIFFKIYVT